MTKSSFQLFCELFLAHLIRATEQGRIRWRRGAAPDSLIGLTNAGALRLSQTEEDGSRAFKVEVVNSHRQVEMELTTIGDGPHLAKALYDFARATVLYRERELQLLLDELEQKSSDRFRQAI